MQYKKGTYQAAGKQLPDSTQSKVIKASEPIDPQKSKKRNSRGKYVTETHSESYLCEISAYVQYADLIKHPRCLPWANTSPVTLNH